MELMEAIQTRRSIRKFRPVSVEQDKLGVILDAGRVAPNAGNIQDRRFILVRDKGAIEALARACLNQMWIAGAQAIIVIGSKGEKSKYFYKKSAKFFMNQTCSAAAQNMLLAALEVGLSTTWVSAFNDHEVKSILGMPEGVEPYVVLPIGYADEEVPEPMHYRLEQVTYFERWGNRLKDADWVLQNYNFVGRAIEGGENFFKWISDAAKDIFNKFNKDKEKEEHKKETDKQEMPKELEDAKEELNK